MTDPLTTDALYLRQFHVMRVWLVASHFVQLPEIIKEKCHIKIHHQVTLSASQLAIEKTSGNPEYKPQTLGNIAAEQDLRRIHAINDYYTYNKLNKLSKIDKFYQQLHKKKKKKKKKQSKSEKAT